MLFLYGPDRRSVRRWRKLAPACKARLTAQQITPAEPGTILRDIDKMLDFVGPGGLVTKSRNANFPADRLPELNAKSSHPLTQTLQRPLLRDYPNVAGIFVLLRVMDLLQAKGNRVLVCPANLSFWRSLNPTEQYFALLEALLFEARSSVLEASHRREESNSWNAVLAFLSVLSEDDWLHFDDFDAAYRLGPKGELRPWNLFVQQQLGLIEMRQRAVSTDDYRPGGKGWLIDSARLTPWGITVAWALFDLAQREETAEEAQDEEEADDQEEPGEAQAFGILQPAFQPYFPEWKTIYAPGRPKVPGGTFILKVSVGGWRGNSSAWRRLAVPAGCSLDSLAYAILGAFEFDSDHLYDFAFRDQRGKSRQYYHPYCDEGPHTPDITLGATGLEAGDEMLFTFDYGDDWKFRVKVEKIDAESGARAPKIIASAGKAPDQYPSYE